MKRFAITSAWALILGMGSAQTATAQVRYGYNVNPYNGTVHSRYSLATPYSRGMTSSYYNPFLGYGGQRFQYRNAYGATYTRGYGVNPFMGPYNYNYYRTPVTIWGTTYPNWYMFR